MDLGLRIIHHPDRPSDLPVSVAAQFAKAIAAGTSIAHSVATDGKRAFAVISVRPFRDPLTGRERFGLLLTGEGPEGVVADAPAKRHALNAYRQLVYYAHETYIPNAVAPYAWDYSDVPGIPTNLGADRG